jgi:hypothetical protein
VERYLSNEKVIYSQIKSVYSRVGDYLNNILKLKQELKILNNVLKK